MLTAKIALTLLQLTQYGGPPMWDRDYGNPEYRRERPLPQPRRYGPQIGPCIFESPNNCLGPKIQERYRSPEFRYPRPDRYEPDRYQPDYDGWDDL